MLLNYLVTFFEALLCSAAINTSSIELFNVLRFRLEVRPPLLIHDEEPVVLTYTAGFFMCAVETPVTPARLGSSWVS